MQNIDLIFLFVIAAFIGYYFCKRESVEGLEGFASIDDARQAVREVYNADIDAIRNLSTVATKLQAGGLTIPGTLKVTAGQTIEGLGRLHMFGPELLYILNKSGVVIGKEWGGNGNLSVQGNLQVNESVNVNSISTNNPTWNGWISGNFGSGLKDRVVIGNHENQATVAAHNNALNAWTALRLQGDSINMVPNNGIVNFPNGWRINTADGHFRIQHNGADKLVAHNAGHPIYAPNGMDVGTWKGTGGGTLNVSGNANIGGDTNIGGNIDINGRDRNNVPLKFGNFTLLGQAGHIHFLKNGGAVAAAYCGGNGNWCPR